MQPIAFQVRHQVDVEYLAQEIVDSVGSYEDLIQFVRLLEEKVADWSFAKMLWEMAEEFRLAKIAEDADEAPPVDPTGWGDV